MPGNLVPGPQIFKEHSMPMHVYECMLYPRWGAGLQSGEVGQVEMEEEREEEHDYSPISTE